MRPAHPGRWGGGEVVETIQVQKTVDGVKRQLLLNRVAIPPGINRGRFRADDDIAVVKGDDVSRPFNVHELDVNPGNFRIADDGDGDLGQGTKGKAAIVGQGLTLRQSEVGGAAEPAGVETNLSLPVEEGEFLQSEFRSSGLTPQAAVIGVRVFGNGVCGLYRPLLLVFSLSSG